MLLVTNLMRSLECDGFTVGLIPIPNFYFHFPTYEVDKP